MFADVLAQPTKRMTVCDIHRFFTMRTMSTHAHIIPSQDTQAPGPLAARTQLQGMCHYHVLLMPVKDTNEGQLDRLWNACIRSYIATTGKALALGCDRMWLFAYCEYLRSSRRAPLCAKSIGMIMYEIQFHSKNNKTNNQESNTTPSRVQHNPS